MLKESFYRAGSEAAPLAVPLFTAADAVFVKVAAPNLLSEVTRYIGALRPRSDARYVLVNAMGAGEYYGSNINGDHFPEAALIHAPDAWTGNPLIDKIRAKEWPYGFPTFYGAHPYAHHRNKDASRAFGEVELAAWNPGMRRVELVVRVDKDKCERFGGVSVWDKLALGQYPDVSMGCKVPFDTCSICLDWDLYRKAQATFDPKKHKHGGDAVLAVHRGHKAKNGKGIRGVSITRADYCEHGRKMMNRILPDGRKVFVYNDYPKFFDISFVFIGADKTAKVMMKVAEGQAAGAPARVMHVPAEPVGAASHAKVASVGEEALKFAFLGKHAKDKESEIIKDVLPSQFASKAVPLLTRHEPHLPREILNLLGRGDLGQALATPTALGIVLRPQEFQRVILVQCGRSGIADELDDADHVFPASSECASLPLEPSMFSLALAKLLLPFMAVRSALGPAIERRVVLLQGKEVQRSKRAGSSLSLPALDKMSAAYNGYRREVMDLVASAQELVSTVTSPADVYLHKLAQASVEQVFTPLAVRYLNQAFWDEVGAAAGGTLKAAQAQADVERGYPSRNTWTIDDIFSGEQKQ